MTTEHERIVRRLRQLAMPDPHDEREVLNAQLFNDAADSIEKLQDAANVALGHMTGGMDGDWRDCNAVDALREAIDGIKIESRISEPRSCGECDLPIFMCECN